MVEALKPEVEGNEGYNIYVETGPGQGQMNTTLCHDVTLTL